MVHGDDSLSLHCIVSLSTDGLYFAPPGNNENEVEEDLVAARAPQREYTNEGYCFKVFFFFSFFLLL